MRKGETKWIGRSVLSIGGLICAASADFIRQDKADAAVGRVMVLLVCGGALLGFVDCKIRFRNLPGQGQAFHLPRFGNVLWQGVKEAVDKYGFGCVHGVDFRRVPSVFPQR